MNQQPVTWQTDGVMLAAVADYAKPEKLTLEEYMDIRNAMNAAIQKKWHFITCAMYPWYLQIEHGEKVGAAPACTCDRIKSEGTRKKK